NEADGRRTQNCRNHRDLSRQKRDRQTRCKRPGARRRHCDSTRLARGRLTSTVLTRGAALPKIVGDIPTFLTCCRSTRPRSLRSRRLRMIEEPRAMVVKGAIAAGAVALLALSAAAQTAKEFKGATPLVAIQNEPPAKLIADPPIPEQLALGRVFI